MRPDAKGLGSASARRFEEEAFAPEDFRTAEERRWDSEMRRRSSRSWARREGASSGRALEAVAEDGVAVVVGVEDVMVWSGIREDCFRHC